MIIPTFRRPHQLAACLKSIAQVNYRRTAFEVIVVDDGSRCDSMTSSRHAKELLDITLIRQVNAGPAAARNAGASRARGSCLMFLDDDCAPALDYLSILSARAAQARDSAVGGRTVNALTGNMFFDCEPAAG